MDVQRLYRFLERKSRVAAKRAIATIRREVKWLRTYPQLGRSAKHLGPEYRQLPVQFGSEGYIVLYAIRRDVITILAVKHQREFSP